MPGKFSSVKNEELSLQKEADSPLDCDDFLVVGDFSDETVNCNCE